MHFISTEAGTFILKQPLWKRLGLSLILAGFVTAGISMLRNGDYLFGILTIAFFGGCGSIVLIKSRTILMADSEGVSLVYQSKRGQVKKIPWAMIRQFGVATQNLGPLNKQRHLGIYLYDPEYLTKEQGVTAAVFTEVAKQMTSATVDDHATAQVYLPTSLLPASAATIAEELTALQNKFIGTTPN